LPLFHLWGQDLFEKCLHIWPPKPYLCRPNFGNYVSSCKNRRSAIQSTGRSKLYVPHLSGKTGDKVEFSEVLFTDNEGKISAGDAVKAIVKAEIVSDLFRETK
jgi:hypothetical protein